MNEDNSSLYIEMREINNIDCLRFSFVGKLTKEDAVDGVKYWEDIFSYIPDGEKTTIIWDCKQMTGFENSARVEWQQAIRRLNSKIDIVWLVTNSKVIKAGAKLMSAFTSFNIKIVKRVSQISF